jgi:hypothetical protein
MASLSYSKNLNDEFERLPKLNAAAQFTFDHTYNWSTRLFAASNWAFPEKGDNYNNISFGAKTDYVLLNSFSIYASIGYLKQEFQEFVFLKWAPLTQRIRKTESIEIHLGFNYYIL